MFFKLSDKRYCEQFLSNKNYNTTDHFMKLMKFDIKCVRKFLYYIFILSDLRYITVSFAKNLFHLMNKNESRRVLNANKCWQSTHQTHHHINVIYLINIKTWILPFWALWFCNLTSTLTWLTEAKRVLEWQQQFGCVEL